MQQHIFTWNILIPELGSRVFIFFGNVVVGTQTLEHRLQVLENVNRRLHEAVSIDKCQFCQPEVIYLGYPVDKNSRHVDPSKVKVTIGLPVSQKKVKKVVDMFTWYFIYVWFFEYHSLKKS